jgi:hypothetical protein
VLAAAAAAAATPGEHLPPLIILADDPAAPLPPALAALVSGRGVEHARLVAVVSSEWLLDSASAYDALDPFTSTEYLHPAFARERKK